MHYNFNRKPFVFYQADITIQESIHNLINLHLFPEHHLRLGQYDYCHFLNRVDVVWERIGSPYQYGRDALTYCYNIDGPGFSVCLLATWGEDQGTAKIDVVSISPDDEVAVEALQVWLTQVVTGRRPPRNPSDGRELR